MSDPRCFSSQPCVREAAAETRKVTRKINIVYISKQSASKWQLGYGEDRRMMIPFMSKNIHVVNIGLNNVALMAT